MGNGPKEEGGRRRGDVDGEKEGEKRGDDMGGKRSKEPKERMETPSKAQYRDANASKADSNMGGKRQKNWTPVFEMGATGTMDFVALTNLAVTSREMRKVCEEEISTCSIICSKDILQ